MRFLFKSGMSQNADDPHTFRKQYLASTSEDLHGNEQTCEPCLSMFDDVAHYWIRLFVPFLSAFKHIGALFTK